MPADNKKLELRSLLAGKTTEELEELLALDFAEDKAILDAEYISTILEVIEERENSTEERNKETLAAWNKFQEYSKEAESNKLFEAGKSEEPTPDHRRIIEYRQKPRKNSATLRVIAVAAAAMVLLCSTAFGLNIWQVIVEWTEETFSFLTTHNREQLPAPKALEQLRDTVSLWTDIPCVPHCAPEGTQELGNLNVNEQSDRHIVGMGYVTHTREFSIRISIYKTIPDWELGKYQKDTSIYEEYVVNGITHYIVGNNDNLCAMWVNDDIEGYIQGSLTIEELRLMINSIYEE